MPNLVGRPPLQHKRCLDCKEDIELDSRFYYCDKCLEIRHKKSQEWIKQHTKKRAKYDIKKEQDYSSEERKDIVNQWF